MQNTEAVVLCGYEKQQDNELSLKVGDIITDVKQVCVVSEPHLPQDYHIWSNTIIIVVQYNIITGSYV